jgi:tetratricopeptide (TPR) repeat protein
LEQDQLAVTYYDKAIDGGIKTLESYYHRGLTLIKIKAYEDAVLDFDEALKIKQDGPIFLAKARANISLENYRAAMEDLDAAIKLDDNNIDAHYNRALIKEGNEDYEGALLDYNKVIHLSPEDANAYYSRANLKVSNGDAGAAITDAIKATELDPQNASYFKVLGNIYQQLGNSTKACANWQKSLGLGDSKSAFYIKQYCN